MVSQSGSLDLSGVRVLVSGGTSGIGAAMVAALAAAGATVVLTGRDASRATQLAAQLGAATPGPVRGIGMDVRDPEAVESGVRAVTADLGGLDVLIANAGIGMRAVNPDFLHRPIPFYDVPVAGWRESIETNLTGYFLLCRAAVPGMVAAGHGKVVVVTMNHSTMTRRGFVPYGPSRAGAEALARIMAADLAGSGVTVNQLLPGGATRTGMIPPGGGHRDLLDPAVMGPPVCWLAGAASDGVSDQRIVAAEFADWLAKRD